ncbi:MAG: glycosyltransferase [Acidimicrobiales bacterium]|nr:glycosyltransferase [Acidimicrobiales bacterium]
MAADADTTAEHRTPPMLYGVLVTYRRPQALEHYLDVLAQQSKRIDHLFVVDNAPSTVTRDVIARGQKAGSAHQITHLEMAMNLGPAGGFAEGLRAVMAVADDDAWVVMLDDDDPPPWDDMLERVFEFACSQYRRDRRVAMAGRVGARFDYRVGRTVRLRDEQLAGTVDVDYVAGNQFPTVRVAAVRDVGPYRDELFFGFEELEFGLRLRARGYRIVIDGEFSLAARARVNRLGGGFGRPRLTQGAPAWRRYYSVRNLIVILRDHGSWPAALLVTFTAVAKTAVLVVRDPGSAREHTTSVALAVADGWRGRVGRRLEPPVTDR